MKKQFLMLAIGVALCCRAIPSYAAWQPIYSQDFSANPSEWATNNSSRYYWRNSPDFDYHVQYVNDSGDYSVVSVPGINANPFRLEIDFKMESNDYASGVLFGLFDNDMIQIGPNRTSNIVIVYGTNDAGHHLSLWGKGSDGDENWGVGQSPLWQYNTWYHNVLEYDAAAHTAHLVVTTGKGPGGTVLFDATTGNNIYFNDLTKLGFSAIGSGSQIPGASGIGYIDNVILSTPEPATLSLLILGGLAMLRRRRGQ
jgi:hypothetical protein